MRKKKLLRVGLSSNGIFAQRANFARATTHLTARWWTAESTDRLRHRAAAVASRVGTAPPLPTGIEWIQSPFLALDPFRIDTESTATSPTAKHLLEVARRFSVELQSEPVLCTDFLPNIDLTVSADGDGLSVELCNAQALQGRFCEVIDLVDGSPDNWPPSKVSCRASVSFGLVRWWPVSMREQAARSLGPFKVVIDFRKPLVHINFGCFS